MAKNVKMHAAVLVVPNTSAHEALNMLLHSKAPARKLHFELFFNCVEIRLQTFAPDNFYHCTVHSDIHIVHSPTDVHLLEL